MAADGMMKPLLNISIWKSPHSKRRRGLRRYTRHPAHSPSTPRCQPGRRERAVGGVSRVKSGTTHGNLQRSAFGVGKSAGTPNDHRPPTSTQVNGRHVSARPIRYLSDDLFFYIIAWILNPDRWSGLRITQARGGNCASLVGTIQFSCKFFLENSNCQVVFSP